MYDRAGDNTYRGSFDVASGNGIDGVSSTDGIDVTNLPLGPAFPDGMLVVHDHSNSDGSTSNFKYIPWEDVADLGNLVIDTAPNPVADWMI